MIRKILFCDLIVLFYKGLARTKREPSIQKSGDRHWDVLHNRIVVQAGEVVIVVRRNFIINFKRKSHQPAPLFKQCLMAEWYIPFIRIVFDLHNIRVHRVVDIDAMVSIDKI